MIRDITLGQYYPADSILHKLDPRVKLVATITFVVALFLINNWIGYLVATVFLVSVIRLSKVPFRFIVRGLKTIFIILMITLVFNLFLTPGDRVLVQIWKLRITDRGLHTAIFMAIRLVYLIIGSSLMTLTTTPNDLTDGLETLLSPLKKIHVPVHEVSMMMSIALRFIPILMDETSRIKNAQMARGADFESGGLVKKVKSTIPILVPLLLSAFRRADELGDAMDARCYTGGKNRTKYKKLRFTWRDLVAFLLGAALIAGVVLMKIYLPAPY